MRDASASELLDADPFDDDAALERSLADIRRINAVLGWTTLAVREVAREVQASRLSSFSLLDVASGSADIPLAIARWAARAGVEAHIVATDRSPQVVAIARDRAAGVPNFSVERQDALALSYPAGSFDFALCTLALHHFAPEEAVAVLESLARAGRRVLVFDAARSRLAYAGVMLLTRALRTGYMTRHDAPVTVRRAYTASELRVLAEGAGLKDAHVRVAFPFRLSLTASGGA
jgi:ubiquinone/menaquinone biosynthesis C-methylase UbiE